MNGLTTAGLVVGNGTLGVISGTGTSYTVPVTPAASGQVSLSVAAAATADVAGNLSLVSAEADIDFSSIVTFQPPRDAVGFIGSPISLPLVADSTAATATVVIGSETDLAALGLAITATGNGRAVLTGTIPSNLVPGTYPIALTGADGFSSADAGLTLTLVIATATPVATPTLPLTDAQGSANYATIGLATPEGIQSVLAALAGKDASQARAFAFDGVSQAYVELPAQPSGGLTAYTGLFIASRVALPIDLGGTPVPMPAALVLQPGWNLLCIPPINDGVAIQREHPWEDFQLQTIDGVAISNPADLIGTPGGPLTSSEPWLWNGSRYVQVTNLTTGVGYWFKNNGASALRLERTAAQVTGTGSVRGFRARAMGVVTDRGTPPAPPQNGSHHAESSGGNCGTGLGIGLVGLLALSLYRRRSTFV